MAKAKPKKNAGFLGKIKEVLHVEPEADGMSAAHQDRRQRKLQFPADAERRASRHGRRDTDDPNKSVW